jgi:hypothetical protein
MSEYYYIQNHSTNDASRLSFHPSESYEKGYILPNHRTKSEHRKWCGRPVTEHVFITGCQPVDPNRRAAVENPADKVHAFIADYDCPFDKDKLLSKLERILDGGAQPTWMTETFSGGLRLIWEFERPIRIPEGAGKDFLSELSTRLRAPKLAAGFDKGSVEPERYYEVGERWERLGGELNYDLLTGVLFKSFTPVASSEVTVPFEAVQEEVIKRFGDRLGSIDFEIGERTPLFWIDDGINRIGAEIKEEGMIAYSDRASSVWNDWGEILGREWVAQYEERHISQSTDAFYTDGNKFWIVERGRIYDESRDNFILRLRNLGFSPNKKKGKSLSELEKVIMYINSQKRVDGVGPFVFRDETVVDVDGQHILNTSRNRPTQPGGDSDTSKFPWIFKFISGLFDGTEVAPNCTQLDLFLAWLQRFYIAAQEKKRLSGHCLIISGPTGRGKTLLSKQIVGGLVGGSEDASSYLTGRESFNSKLIEKALWRVDDTSSASDWRENRKMTDLIKRSVANPFVEARAMYRNPQEVEWNGRLMISLNEDASSLSVVPQQDSSNRDKVIGLRISDQAPQDFPDNDALEATITMELPYFASWLKSWVVPNELKGKSRYGVEAWFHPNLRDAARDNSPTQVVMENLDLFAKLHREDHANIWTGTSAELLGAMGDYMQLRTRGGSFEQQRLSRDLQQASENCQDNPSVRPVHCMNTGGGKVWIINLEEKYDLTHE